MIESARRNGVKLSVQYCTRFFREARQAKLAVSSGWLGKIVLGRVDANWFHTMSSYFNKDAYRGTWQGEGGGTAFHHGRYATDLYLHLMEDSLTEVAAFTGRFMHDVEVEDASTASLRFASGALGHVTTTVCAHRNDAIPYDRVELLGEKASLQVYRGSIGAPRPTAPPTYSTSHRKMAPTPPSCGPASTRRFSRTTAISRRSRCANFSMQFNSTRTCRFRAIAPARMSSWSARPTNRR